MRLVLERDRYITLASYAFSLASILYVIKILNLSGIEYHPTINRITYSYRFNGYLVSSEIESMLIILLSSMVMILTLKDVRIRFLPLLSILLLIDNSILEVASYLVLPFASLLIYKMRRVSIDSIISSMLIIILSLEAYILFTWLYAPNSDHLAKLEMSIFYIVGLLSPYLILIISFSYLLKPYIKPIRLEHKNDLRLEHRMILYASIIISIILPVYPYLPSVNPDMRSISVDEAYYREWISMIDKNGYELQDIFTRPYYEERPLTILLIYAMNPFIDLRFLPILLTPSLALSTYYSISKIVDKKSASIAALLSLTSYITIVGIYAGFYANWLALIIFYLSIPSLLNLLNNYNIKNLAIASSFIFAISLFHSYTWLYIIIALIVFTLISIFYKRRYILPLILLLLINLAIIFVKDYYISIGRAVELSDLLIKIDNFNDRWVNLSHLFTDFMGGYFTNTIMLLLALIGVLRSDLRRDLDRLLLSMTYIASIILIFGDYSIQARVLYNMPLHVLASFAFPLLNKRYSILLFLAITLHLLIYSFRALANMYPIY